MPVALWHDSEYKERDVDEEAFTYDVKEPIRQNEAHITEIQAPVMKQSAT